MLNRVVIQGRIGKDIELRHTQSGVSVVSFSIAVDRDFKDKATGESVYFGDSRKKESEGDTPESDRPEQNGQEFSEVDDDGELPF